MRSLPLLFAALLLCVYVTVARAGVAIQPCAVDIKPVYQEGALAANTLLANATTHLYPQLVGPESFAFTSRGFYTGTSNGLVSFVKLPEFTIESQFRTGETVPECGSAEYEAVCGRPLGLHLTKNNKELLICDTLGLLSRNLVTNVTTTLVNTIGNKKLTFCNSIVETSDGTIYFDDSSYKWPRSQVLYLGFEACPQGTIYSYNRKTGQVKSVVSNLAFPNGMALTPNEDSILIVESTRFRIVRLWIKGAKKGKTEVFTKNLPGVGDNIVYDPVFRVYWVGFTGHRFSPESVLDVIFKYPYLRDDLTELMTYQQLMGLVPAYSLAVAIDEKGKIVGSLQDPAATLYPISEVIRNGNYLYFGSWAKPWVGRLHSDIAKKGLTSAHRKKYHL